MMPAGGGSWPGWALAIAICAFGHAARAGDAEEGTTALPAWVDHVVIPWERLDDVATRYGVENDDIVRWNELDTEGRRYLRSGKRLRILARRFPPPRQRMTHVVRDGDTWRKIARRYGRDSKQLRRWNPRLSRRRLAPGDRVVLWLDAGVPNPALGLRGPPVETVDVPGGGLSVGRPHRGRLENGVKLPESELYTIRLPYQSYGTTLAVRNLQKAIATFRYRTAFAGEIVIGAMSRRTGRRLRPHKSHQSGRDVDIRLPAMPHAQGKARLRSDDVDWHAAWALIEALVDTNAVRRIYLEASRQRRLRRAAKGMGASAERIAAVIGSTGIVRHSPGHTGHIHVRFRCSQEAPRCRD
jgi:hypothetical protein